MYILAVDDEALALERIREILGNIIPDSSLTTIQDGTKVIEYVKDNPIDLVFLDINLGTVSGVDLAKEIKLLKPNCNIVFCTGYKEYMEDAFEIGVSDYLTKPVDERKVRRALENMRHLPEMLVLKSQKLYCQCFGNFEVFYDKKPLVFKYNKTRELLAYLIDRNGALCTNDEIICAIWEDDDHSNYLRKLRSDLMNTLKQIKEEDAIILRKGLMAVKKEKFECDYYNWIKGDPTAINLYFGEYMNQYSWAEFTNGLIYDKLQK